MVVSMSEREFSRLGVLMEVQARRLRVDDAAQLLKLKRRQIFRLLKGLRTEGAASLASKRRGRTSNNKLPTAERHF
jgi:DNA-binding IclR family transcriptional regulator